MSNQQHTPGPWKLNGSIVTTENGTPIASAQYYGIHGSKECDDNALLIAAAPELLEACQSLVNWCDKNKPAGEALFFVTQARAAIAKATGS